MEEPLYLPIHQQHMGEDLKQKFRGIAVYGAEDEELFDSASIPGDSDDDTVSSSSLDLTEDEVSSPTKPSSASSSSSSSLSSQLDSKGPLFELSSLMAQLPIKRGLSKYYGGKAQSFTSLANARSIEDLPKKERRKMKPCKSYAGGLDACQKQLYAPGASSKTISKKASRGGSCTSLVARKSSTGLLCSSKPRLIPVHRNMLHALIKHMNETQ